MIILALAILITQSAPEVAPKPEPRYTLVDWGDHATTMLFVHNTTIKVEPTGVRAWTTYVYNGKDIHAKIKIYKDYSEYHCGSDEVTLLYFQTENVTGAVLDAQKIETMKRDYIIPDSLGQSVYDYVCLGSDARRAMPKEDRAWRYIPDDKDIREISDLSFQRSTANSAKPVRK